MPARSLMTLLAGLAVGTLIGAQIHGGVVGAALNPCPAPSATPGGKLVFASPTPAKQTPTAIAKAKAAGKLLLTMTAKVVEEVETDSAVFKTPGAFSIQYTSAMLDTSQGSGGAAFSIVVYSVDKKSDNAVDDIVLLGSTDVGKPTPNSTSVLRGDDCSKGCYLEVTASNLAYTIQVTQ